MNDPKRQSLPRAARALMAAAAGTALLIAQWTEHTWKQVPAPDTGTVDAVAATSARDAWAVGSTIVGHERTDTLILHWNGKTWS